MNKEGFARGRGGGGGPVGLSFLGGGAPSSSDLTAGLVGLAASCGLDAAGGETLVSVRGRLMTEEPLGTMARGVEAGGGGFGAEGGSFEGVAMEVVAAASCFGGRMVGVKKGVLRGLALEGMTTVRIAGGAAERNDSAVTCERGGQ